MEIVSWATGVNRYILNDTSIEIGTNSVQADNSDNGSEMTYLKNSGSPDVYSVSMRFSNSTTDSFFLNHTDSNGDHITEWQAFLNWFKWVTMMGSKPFYFHKIDDPNDDKTSRACIYKIKSSGLPKGTPEGEYVKCTMTWQQWLNEYISVPVEEVTADTLYAVNGTLDLRFTEQPDEPPVKSDFTGTSDYYDDPSDFVIKRVDYDGYKSCVLYFDEFSVAGTYTINITYNGETISTKLIVEES